MRAEANGHIVGSQPKGKTEFPGHFSFIALMLAGGGFLRLFLRHPAFLGTDGISIAHVRPALGMRIIMLAALTTLSSRNTPVRADNKAKPADKVAWDYRAAAQYLDGREAWWREWDHDKRDHETRCVSCHTQTPYALARPELRSALGEPGPSPSEKAMLADIEKRVRNWNQMLPFYSDEKYGAGKEIESRNAESVLNAVILSSYDAQQKHQSELTRLAFDHAWELQSRTGPGCRRLGVAGLCLHSVGVEGIAIPLGSIDGCCRR